MPERAKESQCEQRRSDRNALDAPLSHSLTHSLGRGSGGSSRLVHGRRGPTLPPRIPSHPTLPPLSVASPCGHHGCPRRRRRRPRRGRHHTPPHRRGRGEARAARRARPGPGRPQHHVLLQRLQRGDGRHQGEEGKGERGKEERAGRESKRESKRAHSGRRRRRRSQTWSTSFRTHVRCLSSLPPLQDGTPIPVMITAFTDKSYTYVSGERVDSGAR